MRWWTKLMVLVLMLGMVGAADAKGTTKHASLVMKGKIVKISGNEVTIAPTHKKSGTKNFVMHTTAKTAITIHGAAGKAITDLKAGENVTVTYSKKTASKIIVPTTHHKKK